jgi:ubiquinone/menaquinone biosynthesis C-methylase UbiE
MHYTKEHARSYAAHRRVQGEVLNGLIDEGSVREGTRVIEVGCGSCNYLRALRELTGCAASGFDPSEGMLSEARRLGGDLAIRQGRAEEIAGLFPAESADLVYSVDVIHHLGDLAAYFAGAHRVLKPGGRICTVTDSEQIIRNRRPLSEYWPETVAQELGRYPALARLEEEERRAGFQELFTLTVFREYRLTSAESYRRKAFSSLNLITAEEFERGLGRLQRDLARGPIVANSSYVLLWGRKG